METAILARANLLAPLSAWVERFANRCVVHAAAAMPAASDRYRSPLQPAAGDASAVRAYPPCANDARNPSASALHRRTPALRVVHVVEGAQPPHCAGRMVISGRMADVCAELDRLSAREAATY